MIINRHCSHSSHSISVPSQEQKIQQDSLAVPHEQSAVERGLEEVHPHFMSFNISNRSCETYNDKGIGTRMVETSG